MSEPTLFGHTGFEVVDVDRARVDSARMETATDPPTTPSPSLESARLRHIAEQASGDVTDDVTDDVNVALARLWHVAE